MSLDHGQMKQLLTQYSSPIQDKSKDLSIILSAGHGKRIKSNTSKMLHKIWEVPTILRVYKAIEKGLDHPNQILVVGIKADEVVRTVSKRANTAFAYQDIQKGTGHAVQCALELVDQSYQGNMYILPGDMGLITPKLLSVMKESFLNSKVDMMVLTGQFIGDPLKNHYGHIIRVPSKDASGNSVPRHIQGNVIEIIEFKDIMAIKGIYEVSYQNINFHFSKNELLSITEFNTGVFAFKAAQLFKYLPMIESNNVQGEIYLTDLIAIFNKHNLSVGAISADNSDDVIGFNNKSVLKNMIETARERVYEELKDIITIESPEDFFIAYEVVEDLLARDREGIVLDIVIKKGAYIGSNVSLGTGVQVGKHVRIDGLDGFVSIGNNSIIDENSQIIAGDQQRILIGDNVQIGWNNDLRGEIMVENDVQFGSIVHLFGTKENPASIGQKSRIEGFSQIVKSRIGRQCLIKHSILDEKVVSDKAVIQYYLPEVVGKEAIQDL